MSDSWCPVTGQKGSDVDYVPLKQARLFDQVVNHLTDRILGGQLAAGEFLPSEPELARRLQVSRATIREALRVLEVHGFIERRHGVGVLVADRSHEAAVTSLSLLLRRAGSTLGDLLETRLSLECQIAALAAARATEAQRLALAGALDPMRRPSSSVVEYVDADLAFHLLLAQASHNAVLVALVNAIQDLLRESIQATYEIDGRTERRLHDHTHILDAIGRRDAAGARAAMRAHLRHTQENLLALGLIPADDIALDAGAPENPPDANCQD